MMMPLIEELPEHAGAAADPQGAGAATEKEVGEEEEEEKEEKEEEKEEEEEEDSEVDAGLHGQTKMDGEHAAWAWAFSLQERSTWNCVSRTSISCSSWEETVGGRGGAA